MVDRCVGGAVRGHRTTSHGATHVVICDYDATWPARFSELAGRVKAHLGALVIQVEHVGSTAVPGLSAKPVIDMDVVLASESDLPEAIRRLATLGYAYEGELGIAGRHAFRWPTGEARHHLYVLAAGAPELQRHLAFRDALRADGTMRDAYSELKKGLALQYAHDRQAYAEAKSTFISLQLANRTGTKSFSRSAQHSRPTIPDFSDDCDRPDADDQ